MFGNLEIANGTQNTLSKIELRNNRAGAENFNFLCSFLAKSNSPTDDENRITFEAEYHRLMKLKIMRIRELTKLSLLLFRISKLLPRTLDR